MPRKNYPIRKFNKKRYMSKNAKWRRARRGLQRRVNNLARRVYKSEDNRWLDIIQSPFSSSTSGVTVDLMGLATIAQGDDTYNRDGNRINVTSFKFKGMLTCADLYNIVRVMLVQFTDPNCTGSLPNINDVLENSPPAVVASIFSPYKKNGKRKFKILYDKTHWLQAHQGFTYYPSRKPLNFNLKWKTGLNIAYDQTYGTMPVTNGIYLMAVSDSGAALHPTIEGKGRLTFTG